MKTGGALSVGSLAVAGRDSVTLNGTAKAVPILGAITVNRLVGGVLVPAGDFVLTATALALTAPIPGAIVALAAGGAG